MATPAPELDLAARRYGQIRSLSEQLTEPLADEDFVVQTMADVSPTKWHLAHTSWFFETFVLVPELEGYEIFHPRYELLFNSYYHAVGEQFCRPRRGLLSRPTVAEIFAYRRYVDEAMERLFAIGVRDDVHITIEVGLHHEQQHQELLLMDIKHVFSSNPLYPVYCHKPLALARSCPELGFRRIKGGRVLVGADDDRFTYDNERPRHEVLIADFAIADRPICNAEYAEFIDDGGYQQPLLWLSDGWQWLQDHGIEQPLYWVGDAGDRAEFTLHGLQSLDPAGTLCHLSYYEAQAFATWADARLPTEQEWEHVARQQKVAGQFLNPDRLHPRGAAEQEFFGGAWTWTQSPYAGYPGFVPTAGELAEYNGKFMCNQMVLRGGSCLTSLDHIRASYRNFFYPHMRWQMGGLRLARDA